LNLLPDKFSDHPKTIENNAVNFDVCVDNDNIAQKRTQDEALWYSRKHKKGQETSLICGQKLI
jgi:hypothetical protein